MGNAMALGQHAMRLALLAVGADSTYAQAFADSIPARVKSIEPFIPHRDGRNKLLAAPQN